MIDPQYVFVFLNGKKESTGRERERESQLVEKRERERGVHRLIIEIN